MINTGARTPITSLKYFPDIIEDFTELGYLETYLEPFAQYWFGWSNSGPYRDRNSVRRRIKQDRVATTGGAVQVPHFTGMLNHIQQNHSCATQRSKKPNSAT
jgi:hypothetical protein